MLDLETQVRVYAEHVDSLAPTVAELTPDVSEAAPAPIRTVVRRGWAVAIAAAVAVLVLIGGAGLLLRPSAEQQPVATAPAQPQPSDAPQPEPTSVPEPETTVAPQPEPTLADAATITWSAASLEEDDVGRLSNLIVVTRFGDEWVAMGQSSAPDGDLEIAVWTSPDGLTWRQTSALPDARDLIGDRNQLPVFMPKDLIVGPNGLVVAGYLDSEVRGVRPTVFVSSDARTWSRIDIDASTQGMIHGAARGPEGLIAVGYVETTAIWRSDDGQNWERVDPASPALTAEDHISDVVYGPAGWVAVGSGSQTEGDEGPMAWFSPDSQTWTRVPIPAKWDDSRCHFHAWHVAANAEGYVAVGRCQYPARGVTTWTSRDGLTWTQITQVEGIFDESASIQDVIATPAGYVAVGSRRIDDGPVAAAVWTSTDGSTWSISYPDLPGSLSVVTAQDNTLVAVGYGAPVAENEGASPMVFLGTIDP